VRAGYDPCMATEPAIAFCVREHDEPALEIRVNFGVFAGRDVTPAEIDELARALRPELDEFSVIAEERHEFAGDVEASVHQVRIEVARDALRGDPETLCDTIVETAEQWAQACIADRHAEVTELS
jgi:hypothetical protein